MKEKNHCPEYAGYKTALQWKKKGLKPKENAEGVELWTSHAHFKKKVYYSPDDVCEMTADEKAEADKQRKERNNRNSKIRRERKKAQMLAEQEEAQRIAKEREVKETVAPYKAKIYELQRVINKLAVAYSPDCGGDTTIVIDTETTGLNSSDDELLQVSIIDSDGNTLFDSLIRPTLLSSWSEAEAINGISPEMVKDAPTISEVITTINEICSKANRIVGYNTSFDLGFLENNGLFVPKNAEIVDVMEMFAPIYGEWNERRGCYKWKKLVEAAAYYGYDWNSRSEKAHNSLADCYATLYVYQHILDDEE